MTTDVENTKEVEQKEEKNSLGSVIGKMDFALQNHLSNGEIAALRRISPGSPYCSAFWKILAMCISHSGFIRTHDPGRTDDERKFAVLLSGMTQMSKFHRYGSRLGTVLAQAGFSELRFVRLIQAEGATLEQGILRASRYLASKGKPVDWTDFARLLVYSKGPYADKVRRQIARDYYTIVNAPQKQS